MSTTATPTATWGIAPEVRRAIARTVLELRDVLEDDVRKQLVALGVRPDGLRDLPPGRALSEDDARARAVAAAAVDALVAGGTPRDQAIDDYVRDTAFTFLNRLVGLRCLEERGLLHVDGVPTKAITIDPSRGASPLYWKVRNELPPATKGRDLWREALRRACAAVSRQVRVLFDPDSEYAAIFPLLPTVQRAVEALNAPEIPPAAYLQDEFLGWVYQYYNSREKQEVYDGLAKGRKLERPEDISAATCLYTERYMVDYLLQNTLGTLWVDLHPDSALPATWPYYVRPSLNDDGGGTGSPSPVSGRGARGEGPRRLRDVTLIDPACGSGHFLVRAFDLLAAMYREEGLEPEAEIAHLILERNLHGIDIDLRAVQIAALALYLKGCGLAGPDFRPRRLNLVSADVALSTDAPPIAYMGRFQGDKEMEALVTGIWRGLKNAREFGSLLQPERAIDEVVRRRREQDRGTFWESGAVAWERWKIDLLAGLREEFERQALSEDLGQRLFGEGAARGISLVEALGRRYDVVVMNPPYAGSKNMGPELKKFVEREYKEGKRDLYAAFIQRCQDFCRHGGYVGMVTQQSWLFLRSYTDLRRVILDETTVTNLVHLGPRAFEEISGEVVNIALFSVRRQRPDREHRIWAFRLVGSKSPAEKESLLRRAIAGHAAGVISMPTQADLSAIPEQPFVYWLRPRFFALLKSVRRLVDIAEVRQGLATTDNERFLRCFWEVSSFGVVQHNKPVTGRWFWYVKGGRYQKWAGLEWLVVNWEQDGAAIKKHVVTLPGTSHWSRRVANEPYYFRHGLTYTQMSRGSMGVRTMQDSIFDVKGMSIFSHTAVIELPAVAALLSTHISSYLLRITTQNLEFHAGYVENMPLPCEFGQSLTGIGKGCIDLKGWLVAKDALEHEFGSHISEQPQAVSLVMRWHRAENEMGAVQAVLHGLEGLNERLVCDAYELDEGDVQAVMDETGTPAAWHPVIAGYDDLPTLPTGLSLPSELAAWLREGPRVTLAPHELDRLKARLRALYGAGDASPSAAASADDEDTSGDGDGEETEALGAHIPVPAETLLEEIAQQARVHPISVYHLLREMREREGLVSRPELRRHLEDYVSITVLRLLGYRWPEQDAYEREHGPILDSALVQQDGIIPLVPCGNEPTAHALVAARLERDFGEEGASRSEDEFRQYVGRDLRDWLRRDFFKRHAQQFKNRPIAWHLVSPERTFEALVLYHRLSRETLGLLRNQYAGALLARLHGEQQNARDRKNAAEVSRLQLAIEDVEEFRERIEAIERGDELRYRVRCRWKGEEKDGRPGPYAPDIDDGVKVNLRPYQEAGLLAAKKVIAKW